MDSCSKMESTRDFFSKLRKMAVTLEAETEKLQQAFEGRKNEDGDSGERGSNKLCCSVLTPKHVPMYLVSTYMAILVCFVLDTAVRAMRAYHEVNSDVSSLKVRLEHDAPARVSALTNRSVTPAQHPTPLTFVLCNYVHRSCANICIFFPLLAKEIIYCLCTVSFSLFGRKMYLMFWICGKNVWQKTEKHSQE